MPPLLPFGMANPVVRSAIHVETSRIREAIKEAFKHEMKDVVTDLKQEMHVASNGSNPNNANRIRKLEEKHRKATEHLNNCRRESNQRRLALQQCDASRQDQETLLAEMITLSGFVLGADQQAFDGAAAALTATVDRVFGGDQDAKRVYVEYTAGLRAALGRIRHVVNMLHVETTRSDRRQDEIQRLQGVLVTERENVARLQREHEQELVRLRDELTQFVRRDEEHEQELGLRDVTIDELRQQLEDCNHLHEIQRRFLEKMIRLADLASRGENSFREARERMVTYLRQPDNGLTDAMRGQYLNLIAGITAYANRALDLATQIENLTAELDNLRGKMVDLRAYSNRIKYELEQKPTTDENLQGQVATLTARIAELEKTRDQLKSDLAECRGVLANEREASAKNLRELAETHQREIARMTKEQDDFQQRTRQELERVNNEHAEALKVQVEQHSRGLAALRLKLDEAHEKSTGEAQRAHLAEMEANMGSLAAASKVNIANLEEQLERQKALISSGTIDKMAMEESSAKVAALEATLDEHGAQTTRLQAELKACNEKFAEQMGVLEKLQARFDASVSEASEAKGKLEESQATVAKLNSQIAKIEGDIEANDGTKESLQKQVEDLTAAAQRTGSEWSTKYNNKLSELQKEAAEAAKASLEEKNSLEAEKRILEGDLRLANRETTKAEHEVQTKDKEKAKLEALLDECKIDLASKTTALKELQEKHDEVVSAARAVEEELVKKDGKIERLTKEIDVCNTKTARLQETMDTLQRTSGELTPDQASQLKILEDQLEELKSANAATVDELRKEKAELTEAKSAAEQALETANTTLGEERTTSTLLRDEIRRLPDEIRAERKEEIDGLLQQLETRRIELQTCLEKLAGKGDDYDQPSPGGFGRGGGRGGWRDDDSEKEEKEEDEQVYPPGDDESEKEEKEEDKQVDPPGDVDYYAAGISGGKGFPTDNTLHKNFLDRHEPDSRDTKAEKHDFIHDRLTSTAPGPRTTLKFQKGGNVSLNLEKLKLYQNYKKTVGPVQEKLGRDLTKAENVRMWGLMMHKDGVYYQVPVIKNGVVAKDKDGKTITRPHKIEPQAQPTRKSNRDSKAPERYGYSGFNLSSLFLWL